APSQGHAHGAHHVQAGGIALRDESRAPGLPLRRIGQQLRAYQAGQRQVVEEVVHELFARDPEDEVVLAGAVVRGTAAATRTAATLGPADAVAPHVFAVTGMHR